MEYTEKNRTSTEVKSLRQWPAPGKVAREVKRTAVDSRLRGNDGWHANDGFNLVGFFPADFPLHVAPAGSEAGSEESAHFRLCGISVSGRISGDAHRKCTTHEVRAPQYFLLGYNHACVTHIYHITHFSNLAGIIASGGLFCDRHAQEMDCVKIGHRHIKERRLRRKVALPPGGCVGDYVPFYFAPRSPMLYAIHKGFVEGYNSGQSEVVHLVSSAELVDKADLRWVFSDGHAEMAPLTAFYNSLEHLDKIDWDLMKSQFWYDTDADPDRKRRRQAEFLVHNFFPWELITSIGVYDRTTASHVDKALEKAEHKPSVSAENSWYY